jgi:dTDP-4-amino-4,6-dideoxygalactose transaminase
MTRPTVPFFDLIEQHQPLKDELLNAFSDALDTGEFIGGPQVAAFEKEFSGFIGAPFAAGVANGTEALRLALAAMYIDRDSRVVTVPNTFVATTEAISMTGAAIDFIDVDPETSLMDPNRLEDFLKNSKVRPKAVVPVHLYGQCADMDAINALADKYELCVLEDAAQAHGATYKGKPAGTLGDAAGFSFYPSKNLGACGEAGAVTTVHKEIAETVMMMREHGSKTKYYHDIEGCNSRMHAIQARFLRIKLPYLQAWNDARRQIAEFYDEHLRDIEWLRPVKTLSHNRSCHHLYIIHTKSRDALQQHLQKQGIGTARHYPVPLHLQKCYRYMKLGPGSFPNAERAAEELLSLPMFPELTQDQAEVVMDVIKEFTP